MGRIRRCGEPVLAFIKLDEEGKIQAHRNVNGHERMITAARTWLGQAWRRVQHILVAGNIRCDRHKIHPYVTDKAWQEWQHGVMYMLLSGRSRLSAKTPSCSGDGAVWRYVGVIS